MERLLGVPEADEFEAPGVAQRGPRGHARQGARRDVERRRLLPRRPQLPASFEEEVRVREGDGAEGIIDRVIEP